MNSVSAQKYLVLDIDIVEKQDKNLFKFYRKYLKSLDLLPGNLDLL